MSETSAPVVTGERADLLAALAKQRHFLRFTARDLTDEQAAQRSTASELSVGGIIKHVTLTERRWIRFIQDGPAAMSWSESDMSDWMAGFRMLPGETLTGLLQAYEQVAQETAEVVATLPDLDASAAAARGALVRARRQLVGPPGATARAGRDRAARRARGHHP